MYHIVLIVGWVVLVLCVYCADVPVCAHTCLYLGVCVCGDVLCMRFRWFVTHVCELLLIACVVTLVHVCLLLATLYQN